MTWRRRQCGEISAAEVPGAGATILLRMLVVLLQLVELLLRVLPSPLDQLLHLQLEIFEGLEEAAQVIKLQWKTALSNFNHFPHPCRSCLRVS